MKAKPSTKSKSPTMFELMRAVVRRVPKGKVATYGDIAMAAGFPTGSRQAAWALKHGGPLLPWHRIIGKGGKILLRGQNGVDQVLRLEAEGVTVHGARVDLKKYGHEFRVTASKATSVSRRSSKSTR